MQHARTDYNERIQDSAGIIPADEPVFLLRAQDKHAANLVRQWAIQYLMDNANSNPDARQVYEALTRHADKMTAWQPKKLPDVPAQLMAK
ncbi:MAG: hypothetical protein ACP5SH_09985 [Syntrophobacteraceae bacterium]